MTHATEAFRQFIEATCGTDPGDIIADGRWHRFRIEGTRSKSSKPGRYLLHDDERPVGVFMDWRDEAKRHRWFSDAPAISFDREANLARRRARESELAAQFDQAAQAATAYWSKAVNGATAAGHPYLTRKGVGPHGARVKDGGLLVPLYNADGQLRTLQQISEDGARLFWKGSQKEGCYCPIGDFANDQPVVLCEGFSTAASIHEATGYPVAACIDAGNLVSVSRWMGHKWPSRQFIVAGEDDWHLEQRGKENKGRVCAELAARNLGARLVFPNMHGLDTEGGDDFNDMAREFGLDEVAALFAGLVVNTNHSAAGSPLPFEWFDQIDAQLEANWLVEDLIPTAGLCLVYGHPGCGKSFFALDMAMHVARGEPWRDRDVQQGLVVYIGAEGQRGLRQRVAAFRKHHDIHELPFALIPVEVNLLAADGDLKNVLATIEIVAQRYGIPVGMVVIDTLARTFGGGDEIGSDMVAYVNNVGRIQAAFDCTTMVIHHRPKDSANETPRGHGSLWGACDTIILVEDKGGPKQAKVTKQKDADPAPPVLFDLKVVELGEDEKGRPVTSCVVMPSQSAAPPDKQPDTLSDGQRIAFEQLAQTLSATGQRAGNAVPDGVLTFGPDTRICRLSDWHDRTISALCYPGKTPDTLERTFRRYRERLQSLKIIGTYENFVWRIK